MMRLLFRKAWVLFLISLALLIEACTPVPISEDSGLALAPSIQKFSFTPNDVDLDSLVPDSRGRVRVDFQVSVETNLETEAITVSLISEDGDDVLATSSLVLSSSRKGASGEVSVLLTKSQTGRYLLVASAFSSKGISFSNSRGSVNLRARINYLPVLIQVNSPDTVFIPTPTEGRRVFQITAVATDTNGIADIREILATRLDNPQITFSLLNDGDRNGQSGDFSAADSVFTATLQINSDNTSVTRTFSYQAIDKSGAKSNIIQRSITFVR
ncbi:MAG: hypothetical protein SFU91_02125 [Chloroherpetonaceae bacterium]|nr:hypothetical protein [Chloroherpetonaceae bacterium]